MSDKETGFSVLRTGVMFDRDLSVTELQFESVPVTERKINALRRKALTEVSVGVSRCSVVKLQLQSYSLKVYL